MTEELKPAKEPKKKTSKELMEANLDDLTMEELERRAAVIKILEAEANAQDVKDRLDERKNKREMVKDKFESRGREIKKTASDQVMAQNLCSHRKGGRGDAPGGLSKGTSEYYALIKHQLPTQEWWLRCQRCGETFKPAYRENFPTGTEGQADFEKADAKYKWALGANTDNSPSSSVLFKWGSPDANVSADKFVKDVMKDTTLR